MDEQGIFFRISKEEFEEKQSRITSLVFDVDDTLLSYPPILNVANASSSWRVLETGAGFHGDKKYQETSRRHFEIAGKPEYADEDRELVTKLDSFWKGKSVEEATKGLFPIPFFEGVKDFFSYIKNVGKFKVYFMSTACNFLLEKVAQELGFPGQYEGVECIVDKQGRFTGEFRSNGLFGKSLKYYSEKNQLQLDQIAYHGDNAYDLPALRESGLAIAVNPFDGINGIIAQESHLVLTDWHKHPFLEVRS